MIREPDIDTPASPSTAKPSLQYHDHAAPASTWDDYYQRRRLCWILLGPGLLAVLLLGRLLLIEHLGWYGLLSPLALWAVLLLLACLHLQKFRCPRCQCRFFAKHPPLLALRAGRCVHCMLPKD
ncbi:hypothetical protein [Thermomonas sp. HDW16]|uniref:hypothetical protein n=1 Tax=Thermomonas sp. HDW16 TaxID=2714945 RepID=UPI00140E475F|nr:hypothetical protein [Thermomonas sp. HDW16]QIL19517.1 hypothetical protein G7079_01535 [Thermomonas sp. HDW16]